MMISKEDREKEKRESILLKSKGSSGEPLVTKDNYAVELSLSLNWHNIHTDSKIKREWLKKYLIHINSPYTRKSWSHITDFQLSQVGVLCHIIMIGGYLSDKHLGWLNNKIEKLGSISPPIIYKDDTIQQSKEKHLEYCIVLDEILEGYIRTKSTVFNMKSFIIKYNISSSVAKKISAYYTNSLTEVELAIIGEDEQLVEGYSYFSKAELKKYSFILKDIVSESIQTVTKIARPKKEKPVSVIVKDVQYLKEFPSLNMKSIDVKLLHNSKEIWMYNTETKRLVKYKADKDSILAIKGKYIKNYSVEESYSKVIRKPEDFFKHFVMAKVAMSASMKEIKAVESKVNGKIYPENILLKVF